jgi:chemotaxis protein histidine kinase CheA
MSMPPIENMNNQFNAGARARRAQRQGTEDQAAEEAALLRTEENRAREAEENRNREREEAGRRRSEEIVRDAENRTAEHEAMEAEAAEQANESDTSPEEAAVHRTETDRERASGGRAEEAARAEEARAAEHEAAADTARVPIHEQRRIAREQAATREREEGERLERELTRLEDAYARTYGQTKARQGLLARTLGWNNVENDPEVERARQAYVAARNNYNGFQIRQLEGQVGTISEDEFRQRSTALAGEVFQGHDLRLQAKKNEQRQLEDMQRGWFSRRVEDGWNRVIGWYRKLPWYAKLGASAGLMLAGGWAAVAGMGAMRIIGGAAAGKGTQELLQTAADGYRSRRGAERMQTAQRIVESGNLQAQERLRALQNVIGQHDQNLNQRFTRMERGDIVRRHIGVGVGAILGSGVLASYIRETIGDWWTGGHHGAGAGVTPEAAPKGAGPSVIEEANKSPMTGAGPSAIDQAANSPMTGAELPGSAHELLQDPSGTIESGGSIWRTTRELYMDNPGKFGYDANDPKIGRLFESFKSQGILDKMDIDADSFADLSDDDKLKIWAENRTANSVNKLSQLQGGRIHDLVHPGDTVTLKPDGSIMFNADSGIKAGHLSNVEPRGGGGGAYEQGGRGASVSGMEEYDARIEEARGRGQAAQRVLDENMRIKREGLYPEYQAAGAQEAAMLDLRSNYTLLDKMMNDSMGGGFSLSDKVEDVAQNARSFATLPGGQMPETLTAQELSFNSKSADLFNDLFRRFPYQPGQRMDNYLANIKNIDILKLRKLYNV